MNATLLIVDDEAEIRNSLSRHFRFKGYEVECAASVDEAITVLQRTRIQVLISDIMMPDRLGTELLPVLAEEFPMTRAIMITGYVTLENALRCMRKGADSCIFKPFEDMSELDEAVERNIAWHVRWQHKLQELQQAKRGDV